MAEESFPGVTDANHYPGGLLGACPRNILWQINDLYVFQEIRKIPIPSKYAGFLKMAESEITFSRL